MGYQKSPALPGSLRKNGGFGGYGGFGGSKGHGGASGSGDVIGSVVGIEEIVPVMSAAGKKLRRTVVVEDAESNRLNLTFWDAWASMWDQYASKRQKIDHLVVILQLGKVKYWDGSAAVHNALFGSKIYINRDIPEIVSFKTRLDICF
ncbi:hypothetical protein CTI12_AA105390 [Artemisia annua]|uniref:Nucleic acid-binding, OB-fold protein n=1 Tax=Artemisia annua TaxID=35608 RepID=A0A2U1PW43_ARTAN|nr:hypothetical protein CTI12_AA105390 [Artemisia annua]